MLFLTLPPHRPAEFGAPEGSPRLRQHRTLGHVGRKSKISSPEIFGICHGMGHGDNAVVISVELAKRLRAAGVRWSPAPGDRFVIADRDMDDQVFVLADMTVDVHDFETGRVLGFNGTVEWALDSVEQDAALWLPSETQLRELLGGAFVSMSRPADSYEVVVDVAGSRTTIRAAQPDEAYGRALLFLANGDGAD